MDVTFASRCLQWKTATGAVKDSTLVLAAAFDKSLQYQLVVATNWGPAVVICALCAHTWRIRWTADQLPMDRRRTWLGRACRACKRYSEFHTEERVWVRQVGSGIDGCLGASRNPDVTKACLTKPYQIALILLKMCGRANRIMTPAFYTLQGAAHHAAGSQQD